MQSHKENVILSSGRGDFLHESLKVNKKPLKDQCQVFTLEDDATPSLSTNASVTVADSQRLEAIKAAEREIAKERENLVLEKQKMWQFWRNANIQPITRYMFSLPPASWSYISIIVCCVVKIIFCMFIFSMLMHSRDASLLYMMCFIIVHVGSTFATIELIVQKTMKMMGVCATADVVVIIIMIVLLAMVSSDREGEVIVPIERVAATTVVVEVI